MVLVGRATQLDTLFGAVSLLSGEAQSWNELLLELLPGSGKLLDTSGPFDFGVLMRRDGDQIRDPRAVVSISLKSLEAAVGFARRQRSAAQVGAAWLFEPSGGGAGWCAVAASSGPTPARAVCGEARDDVLLALAYMTHTLPLEAHGSKPGFEVELRGDGTRALLGPELPKLLPALWELVGSRALTATAADAEAEQIVRGVAGESAALLADFSELKVSVHLDSDHVVAQLSARAARANAWTTRYLQDYAERPCAAPQVFWMLPQDSGQSGYLCELNPTRVSELRRILGALSQAVLSSRKVSLATRTAVRRLTADWLTLPAHYAWAWGAVPELKKSPLSPGALAARRALGWTIVGVDQPAAVYVDSLRNGLGLLNNQEVLDLVGLDSREGRRAPAPPETASKPNGKRPGEDVLQAVNRVGADLRGRLQDAFINAPITMPAPPSSAAPSASPPATRRRDLRIALERPARAPLPKGSIVFELEIPSSWLDSYPPRPFVRRGLKTFVIVVPDDSPEGRRTWLGLSSDEAALSSRLAAVLKSQRTLQQRRDLAPLTEVARSGGAGFTDLGAILNVLEPSQRSPSMPVFHTLSFPPAAAGVALELRFELDLGAAGVLLATLGDLD